MSLVNVILASNRLQIANEGDDILLDSVTYTNIVSVNPLIAINKHETGFIPGIGSNGYFSLPTTESIYWRVELHLADGRKEYIFLEDVDNQAGWTNDADGYAAAEEDIYAAFPTGGGGGGAPSGPAGGVLSGTYPNPGLATSVALPGSPTTTTQAVNTNNTTLATTAFVQAQLAASGLTPTLRTGSAIAFDVMAIYNTPAAPSSSPVTIDLTGATVTEVIAYFNHATEPTWPADVYAVGSWDPAALNVVRFIRVSDTAISAEIISDAVPAGAQTSVSVFPNVANTPTDYATTSTTASVVPGMTFTVEAGKMYSFDLVVRGSCSGVGGLYFGLFASTGTDHIVRSGGRANNGTTVVVYFTPGSGYNNLATTTPWFASTVANNLGSTHGTIRGGALDAVFELRAASVTGGQTSTVYADGTYMRVTKMN